MSENYDPQDSKYGKSGMLPLLKLLMSKTDEKHSLSMKEITEHLDESHPNHSHSTDSISRYINKIEEELDIEVIKSPLRGKNVRYSISDNDRLFTKEEARLIVDAVNASDFIEKTVAKNIIAKIKNTMSEYDAKKLDNDVLGANNTKSDKKIILQNVSKIQEAIDDDRKIYFKYRYWNKEKELVVPNDKRGKWHNFNPWKLIVANQRLYLYGYDIKKDEKADKLPERHYRVDKMYNINIARDKPREGANQFKNFDKGKYVSKRMGMFAGDEEEITAKIPEELVGVFIDQFGKDGVNISDDEEEGKLQVYIHAAAKNPLLGWLISLENAEVIETLEARQHIIELLDKNKKLYD